MMTAQVNGATKGRPESPKESKRVAADRNLFVLQIVMGARVGDTIKVVGSAQLSDPPVDAPVTANAVSSVTINFLDVRAQAGMRAVKGRARLALLGNSISPG